MLSPKLHARARDLREKAQAGVPLSPDACALLAVILEDLGERVAHIEATAHPAPPPRAPALAVLPGGRAA